MTGFLTGTALKYIACACMLLDHAYIALFPGAYWLHVVGRLAFPLYCFLLAEGFAHTRSVPRYAMRLALFALLSEIPFDLLTQRTVWGPGKQNVFFTLLLGLLAVACLERWNAQPYLALPAAALCGLGAHLLHTDYGWFGVLLVVALYACRCNRLLQGVVCTLLCVGNALLKGSPVSAYAALASLLLLCYNGERGKGGPQYFFYAFYPCHLLLLVALRSLWAG